MARSAVSRWIRDRIEVDSRFSQTPKHLIRQLEKTIEKAHPGHRMEAVEYARQYAVLYYGERHKHTPVPRNVTARLDRLEQRAEKAERFDSARSFVQKYGPPEKALATFMKAPVLEKARVEVQQTKQVEPTKEKLRSHDIPWMMTTGPIHQMSKKHLDQAQRNYDQWPHKDKRSFVEYVNFTREHWNKSPEDRQPAKQQERSREVELSR